MSSSQFTEEELALKKAASDFAKTEIAPVVLKREWIPDPEQRVPWDIFEKASQRGFKTITLPKEYGGLGASNVGVCMVSEEIAKADIGIAVAMGHWWKETSQIAELGTKEQKDWYFSMMMKDDRFLASTCMTEPGHGSDNALPYEPVHYDTTATPEGDNWIINGQKVFITNGRISRVYFVYATTDKSKPFSQGVTLFLVPRDSPGVRIGTVFEKMGLRLSENAEVFFDHVKVPKNRVLGEVNRARAIKNPFALQNGLLAVSNLLGCAEGGYEMTLQYAKDRVQGGQPIIKHEVVGLRLAKMATMIEGVRSILYRAAWEADHNPKYDSSLYFMARYLAGQLVQETSMMALDTFGGNGMMLDMAINKQFRDMLGVNHAPETMDIALIQLWQRIARQSTS